MVFCTGSALAGEVRVSGFYLNGRRLEIVRVSAPVPRVVTYLLRCCGLYPWASCMASSQTDSIPIYTRYDRPIQGTYRHDLLLGGTKNYLSKQESSRLYALIPIFDRAQRQLIFS